MIEKTKSYDQIFMESLYEADQAMRGCELDLSVESAVNTQSKLLRIGKHIWHLNELTVFLVDHASHEVKDRLLKEYINNEYSAIKEMAILQMTCTSSELLGKIDGYALRLLPLLRSIQQRLKNKHVEEEFKV